MGIGVFVRRAPGLAAALEVLAMTTGCSTLPEDCPYRLRCAESSAASTGGSVVDSGLSCAPSADGSAVPDECGVFVRHAGDDNDPGSRANPVATIAQGIALAAKGAGRVYVCADDKAFVETLVISDPVTLYGGIDCKNGWVYTGSGKTTLAPTKGVPLILRGMASGSSLFDFSITAPAGMAGESSIAVIADSVTAALTRCALIADVGGDGGPGFNASVTPAAGKVGSAGGAACSALSVVGGAGATNQCGGTASVGGGGGLGTPNGGFAGVAGIPLLGGGAAGNGDTGAAGWSCAWNGGDGKDGAPGSDGAAGSAASGLGQISALGYQGVSGGDGKAGGPGQGGGGGGGRAGAAAGVCGAGKGGASGGGGGAGGCGGTPGGGGVAGGASIALISLGATLTLTQVALTAAHGGRGGDGGLALAGGAGGNGGNGGSGVNAGCHGGRGGDGGKGGVGGGGSGGHSIGLAYIGAPPSIDDGWITIDVGGAGGVSMGGAGVSGVSAKRQAFE